MHRLNLPGEPECSPRTAVDLLGLTSGLYVATHPYMVEKDIAILATRRRSPKLFIRAAAVVVEDFEAVPGTNSYTVDIEGNAPNFGLRAAFEIEYITGPDDNGGHWHGVYVLRESPPKSVTLNLRERNPEPVLESVSERGALRLMQDLAATGIAAASQDIF